MAHPHVAARAEHHEKAHALIARTGHERLPMRARGGHVSRDEDEREDEALVAEGVGKHESHLHPGEPKTKLKAGGHVEGREAHGHLGRRARGGAAGKKHTNVNVIIAPQGGGGMRPALPTAPPPSAAPPPPMPPRPMPGPPPGAMGAPGMAARPPGMMKRGGGVQKVAEAGVPSESLLQAKRGGGVKRRAAGGEADDCEPEKRARGGKTVHMEAGAGGAEGRIEKMHEYGEGGFKPKEHGGELRKRA